MAQPDPPTAHSQPPLPKPPTPAPDQDLVWVEGNLRVIGDARLVAGKLDYRVTKGGDDGIPIWLRRIKAAPSKAGEPTKIPLEAGIEQQAISFTKGCYVGQEVIIRVLHRGHGRVAQKLVGLLLEPGRDVPAPGTALQADGREVGAVTSSVHSPERTRKSSCWFSAW